MPTAKHKINMGEGQVYEIGDDLGDLDEETLDELRLSDAVLEDDEDPDDEPEQDPNQGSSAANIQLPEGEGGIEESNLQGEEEPEDVEEDDV